MSDRRDESARRAVRLAWDAADAWTAAILALVTFAAYLGWLGWDQRKDLRPDDLTETGPYEWWQVLGLVLVLGAAVALAGWRGRSPVATPVVAAVMSLSFSVDAATDPENDGLWPIGASLVAVGTFVAASGVASAANGFARRRAAHSGA